MAYTSKAQIIDRWGTDEVVRSADRDPEDGVVDDAAVTAACADASSLIDSYLERGGHKTPVVPSCEAHSLDRFLMRSRPVSRAGRMR